MDTDNVCVASFHARWIALLINVVYSTVEPKYKEHFSYQGTASDTSYMYIESVQSNHQNKRVPY